MNKIFEFIFSQNLWNCSESSSGWGSTLENTENIRKQLPLIIKELSVNTFLDLACGDFNRMQKVTLEVKKYIGADIVKSICDKNISRFERYDRTFRKLDMTIDVLPPSEVVFCRDALVHFSFKDIYSAIANIIKSGVRYLFVTTYPNVEINFDICTGGWRPINFQKAPFRWPKPLKMIYDGEKIGHPDWGKYLAIWRIEKIKLPIYASNLYYGSNVVPGSYAVALPSLSFADKYLEHYSRR